MLIRMLRRDFSRNKAITASLTLFIMLAALLISMAVSLIAELLGAMDGLFTNAVSPHFVQMHSGELDQNSIDKFAAGNDLVVSQQTVEMLNVAGKHVTLGDSTASQAASVMEISFVTQNADFDYLLDLSGHTAQVDAGEVGVPIYFMEQNNLQLGDTITVNLDGDPLTLTITCFVRDAQMNPSIVSSKRFLVSPGDWEMIGNTAGSSEYLIEFLLADQAETSAFETQYANSDLPQSDTAITITLYRLLNALSDGLVAAVIILIGLILVVISMLCLRYAILGSLEEDIREIGIMKALGLSASDIRRLYMMKYLVLAAIACLIGYVLSIPMHKLLTENIALYMGTTAKNMWNYLLPLAAAAFILLLIFLIVRMILRRLSRLSAVQALSAGGRRDIPAGRRRLSLRQSRLNNVNLLLALQDLWLRLRSYCLLGFIFMACTFLAITPLNLYHTISSPEFLTYMGAGQSDLRIDLQRSEEIQQAYTEIETYLDADPDIARYSAFVTGIFEAQNKEGEWVPMKIETGNFSVFPLEYAAGNAPQETSDLALSQMNADELGKTLGDSVSIVVNGNLQQMTICGIYQDVTNGGKTAKAILPVSADNILWYVVNIDTLDGVSATAKKAEYARLFPDAKTLDMDDYLQQTLGGVTSQIKLAAICALAVTLAVGVLITAMFFNMMLAKDTSQSAILKSLGFTDQDLGTQYLLRALIILVAGIIFGTVAAGVLGQSLCGMLLSSMGASSIRLIINPLGSYLLIPAALAGSVTLTCLACCRTINKTADLRNNME